MPKHELKIKEKYLISIDELLIVDEKLSDNDDVKGYVFISNNKDIIINVFSSMDGINRYFAFISKNLIEVNDGYEYSFIIDDKTLINKYNIESMQSLDNVLNNPIIKNEIRLNKLKKVCSK